MQIKSIRQSRRLEISSLHRRVEQSLHALNTPYIQQVRHALCLVCAFIFITISRVSDYIPIRYYFYKQRSICMLHCITPVISMDIISQSPPQHNSLVIYTILLSNMQTKYCYYHIFVLKFRP